MQATSVSLYPDVSAGSQHVHEKKMSEAGVYYLIGVRIPPTSPRTRQFFLTGVSTSELRRLFTTLDPRLEIPVENREFILRLLVPAERRAHQKGQRAREVFRLGQNRRSRVRLARFEAERVLPDKETVQ